MRWWRRRRRTGSRCPPTRNRSTSTSISPRYMQQHNEIELSALGMAIGTVVTVAEILKNNGLATEKKILTSTVGTKDDTKGRLVRKARIEILLHKSENFNNLVPATKADQIKAVQPEIEA
ncbi:Uncharacterized protein ACMD2_01054 [Ananas comosus]|uniref:DNA/RNA-binding protein Alba-like domain-containing protein n=1 Tax=Ananas comosus TaxID=4615 RepID=A0A199VV35_ANACO|nr:Uncharacterized protein ACMD2_01054 [Ananas comosus]